MPCIKEKILGLVGQCLSVSVTKKEKSLEASISLASDSVSAKILGLVGQCLSVSVTKKEKSLEASVSLASDSVSAKILLLRENLKVRCSIVCSLAEMVEYLKVSPEEVQWITDEVGVFFDVRSNVEWKVINS